MTIVSPEAHIQPSDEPTYVRPDMPGVESDEQVNERLRQFIETFAPEVAINPSSPESRLFIGMAAVMVSQEVTIQQQTETIQDQEQEIVRLHHATTHDKLTGLLNKEAMDNHMLSKMEEGQAFMGIFIDVDNFKGVNDKNSHDIGDALLEGIGQALKRKSDVLSESARIGGDEFFIITDLKTSASDEEEHSQSTRDEKRTLDIAEQVEKEKAYLHERYDAVAAKLKEELGITVDFGFSIGIAVWLPGQPHDVKVVRKAADLLMYQDKEERKDEARKAGVFTENSR